MSIQPFESGDIEVFTIQTSPSTTFISSSVTGVTGAVNVYARQSNAIKDYHINWASQGAPSGAYSQINSVDDVLNLAKCASTVADRALFVREYLEIIKNQPQSTRATQKQEVVRLTPGVNLDLDMTRKFVTTNVLMPYYSLSGTDYNFSYTNYHSLNFFTASCVPTGSALLYPMSASATSVGSIITSPYIPSGAFSFDFWINPRYTTDTPASEFHAGTIFHLSSAYALSLISGSHHDSNGFVDSYRLLLQLSSSTKLSPSSINPASPTGLAFLSTDNALVRNKWQHVTVRWGTNSYNFGSGSFMIDGVVAGTFYIPSSSVAPRRVSGAELPNMLAIGNFLECRDTAFPGVNADYFFSDHAQTQFGVPVSESAFVISNLTEPASYKLRHPLNAEVHELKIYNKYLGQDEIASRSLSGASPEIGRAHV